MACVQLERDRDQRARDRNRCWTPWTWPPRPTAWPTIIVAHTTKGKGVSFMENKAQWHGLPPNETQYRQALEELGRAA